MSRLVSSRLIESLHTSLLLLFTLTTLTNAACTSFKPVAVYNNENFYTATAMRSYIVSPIVNCTGSAVGTFTSGGRPCNSTECGLSVPANYLVNIEAELNITTSAEQKERILALAKKDGKAGRASPGDFNATVTVSVSGATCIPQGQLQWYALTPTLVCTEGTLEGCSGSDSPASGTAIRACGVQYFAINDNGIGIPSHGPNIVSGSGIESKPAPPNATVIDNDTSGTDASFILAKSCVWVTVLAVMFSTLL